MRGEIISHIAGVGWSDDRRLPRVEATVGLAAAHAEVPPVEGVRLVLLPQLLLQHEGLGQHQQERGQVQRQSATKVTQQAARKLLQFVQKVGGIVLLWLAG